VGACAAAGGVEHHAIAASTCTQSPLTRSPSLQEAAGRPDELKFHGEPGMDRNKGLRMPTSLTSVMDPGCVQAP